VRGVDGYKGNDIDRFELAAGDPHRLSAALIVSMRRPHRMARGSVDPVAFSQG
jgi:hypothetical protein